MYACALGALVHLHEAVVLLMLRMHMYLQFASVVPRVLDHAVVVPVDVTYVRHVMLGHHTPTPHAHRAWCRQLHPCNTWRQ
jgi:hypothetical protein